MSASSGALVKTDLVEQDVCGHEHGVGEQAGADLLVARLARLFLELHHPFEPPDGRRALQQPGQLRVRRHVRLQGIKDVLSFTRPQLTTRTCQYTLSFSADHWLVVMCS